MTEESGFYIWQRQEIFFFSITSRLALETTPTPTELVPEVGSPVVKTQEREAYH
jgi:hypothetical protein